MVRSLALGLVLATGALVGRLPPGEGQIVAFPKNPPDPDVAAALIEQLAAKTKVVCGLTMLQVDPTTDPKIRRDVSPAPAQNPNLTRQPDFKIRRITPAMCRE